MDNNYEKFLEKYKPVQSIFSIGEGEFVTVELLIDALKQLKEKYPGIPVRLLKVSKKSRKTNAEILVARNIADRGLCAFVVDT